ncbi:scavenger receptor cysteine-rich domain-containing protein DMBT1-like [Oculina patagonica]
MNCQWNLTSNVKLELVFLHFKTDYSADYVKVYDGNSPTSPLIGTFSGSSLPAPIMSSSNKLFVTFTSDGAGRNEGFTATYRAITSGAVRLNGSTPSTGRVEIFHNKRWGTICDHGWDITDASVVCRQLGFPKATQAYSGATHGLGLGPIWMDDVACIGGESNIDDCSHRGLRNHNCTHSQDVSVKCSSVRLANGGANYGRVEVCVNGNWGTVCDDYWDINDANVVCRQLGFSSASSAPIGAAYGQGSDPIWMYEVNCQGRETSLFDCTHSDWGLHACGHHEDASVVCNT